MLLRIHHVAIICSNYAVSKRFYVEILGLKVLAEHYQEQRGSYKLDLQLGDGTQLELFRSWMHHHAPPIRRRGD